MSFVWENTIIGGIVVLVLLIAVLLLIMKWSRRK